MPDIPDREATREIIPDSKVGLSLSHCVRDILEGVVQEEEVKGIIAATRADSPSVWDDVIKQYRRIYWSADPERGETIARRFINSGKVEQPRLEGKQAHNISEGHWLNANQVETWRNSQK